MSFSQCHSQLTLKLSSLRLTFSQSQAHSLKLSPLCFNAAGPRSSTSLPPKLDVTDPPADPLSRTPKPPISLKPTPPSTSLPPIHFKSVVSVFFIYMLGIFDLGLTSKKMMDILFSAGTGVPYFPF